MRCTDTEMGKALRPPEINTPSRARRSHPREHRCAQPPGPSGKQNDDSLAPGHSGRLGARLTRAVSGVRRGENRKAGGAFCDAGPWRRADALVLPDCFFFGQIHNTRYKYKYMYIQINIFKCACSYCHAVASPCSPFNPSITTLYFPFAPILPPLFLLHRLLCLKIPAPPYYPISIFIFIST